MKKDNSRLQTIIDLAKSSGKTEAKNKNLRDIIKKLRQEIANIKKDIEKMAKLLAEKDLFILEQSKTIHHLQAVITELANRPTTKIESVGNMNTGVKNQKNDFRLPPISDSEPPKIEQ